MRKILFSRKLGLSILLAALLVSLLPAAAFAASKDDPYAAMPSFGILTEKGLEWRNADTGYRVVIEDDIDLLTEAEERALLGDMLPLTAYGNVAFWSTREYASDEVEQARLKRRALFDLESGSILVINMEIRRVSIQSYGAMYEVLTPARANSITNNVRNYLTRGEYYIASQKAYSQMNSLLRGNRIAQPMKHLSNACIALMVGLILMIGRVFRLSSTFRKEDEAQVIGATALAFAAAAVVNRGQKREYSPPSSDSGSSCSGCSSGSSCSSCGGGGSSSF
ncbi:MAG: TPM domain-containing protein [Oscillospiraceae bacterium]|nr:TPM domain-containing protein [Oscillospiraceae bacterium]